MFGNYWLRVKTGNHFFQGACPSSSLDQVHTCDEIILTAWQDISGHCANQWVLPCKFQLGQRMPESIFARIFRKGWDSTASHCAGETKRQPLAMSAGWTSGVPGSGNIQEGLAIGCSTQGVGRLLVLMTPLMAVSMANHCGKQTNSQYVHSEISSVQLNGAYAQESICRIAA